MLKAPIVNTAPCWLYDQPPADFKQKMEIATCYIRCQDRYLFLLRNPSKPEGSTWGIPGGKLDKGEAPLEGMKREILEETGINLMNNAFISFPVLYIRYETYDFSYLPFATKIDDCPSIQLVEGEHDKYAWLTLEEALGYPLITGEHECIEQHYEHPFFR